MTATRLPAFACVFAFAAATFAHQAIAAEEEPARAKTVLVATAAETAAVVGPQAMISASLAPANSSTAQTRLEGGSQEEWTDPKTLLLVFAALFVFLAHRRRYVE